MSLIEAHKTRWEWKTILNVSFNVTLNETHKTTWRGLMWPLWIFQCASLTWLSPQSYQGYHCKVCNESFPASKFSENFYLKHYKNSHNKLPPEFEDKEKFLCQQCPEFFFKPLQLSIHTSKFHGSGKKQLKEVSCKKCSFTCVGHRQYSEHMLAVHNEVVSKFEMINCRQCDASFKVRFMCRGYP